MRTGDAGRPVERARALGPALESATASIDREGRLPAPVVEQLKAEGLLQLLLPAAYGGAEAEPARFVEVVEELARHDASTGWCVGQLGVCAMAAAYLSPAGAERVFDGGRGVLAWGANASPVPARPEPGGYRVSGRWSFASGGHHATWLGGHCVLADPDGTPQRDKAGNPIPRTLLFPAAEVRWAGDWDVLGLRGTGSETYSVEDLFVPEELTLSREQLDERYEDVPLYRLRTDQMYPFGFAGVALGVARAMLDALVALAGGGKTPRGLRRPMREGAVVQSDVAQLEAALRASRHYLYGTVAEVWSAAVAGKLSMAERVAVRLATTSCIDQARRVGGEVYHMAGSDAIRRGGPFEQRLRDLSSLSQQVQGRKTHYESVGRYLLGLDVDALFI